MIEERGVVKEISENTAQVLVERKKGCEGCASSKMCGALSVGDGNILIPANNSINAKVGNKVLIAVTSRGFLLASALIHIVPILGLLGGILVGHFVTSKNFSSDEMSFFMGFIGLIISIFMIKGYNRSFENNPDLVPQITRIL